MGIPFNKPFIVGKELDYITQAVMEEKHLSGNGKYTQLCQQWLENELGCVKAHLTHSGTAALEMAALLCDIHPGDEIIMPSFTFVSTANAFVLRGATPVFVDIRRDTLNINEEVAEKAITPRTKAVVPVHYAGVACSMDEINAVAKEHGLWVIEDAAHALLSTYKGSYLGTIGHLGCLSFHETKNVTSGEGGALLINDPNLIERAGIIWDKGTNRSQFLRGEVNKYSWVDIGASFLPTELVGAFLYAQLEKANMIMEKRRHIFSRYYAALKPFEEKSCFRLPFIGKDSIANGHLFYLLTNSLKDRDHLIEHLKSDGILAPFHYIPLHSSPAGRKFGRIFGNMNGTDETSNRLLRLPLFYGITDDEIDMVIDSVARFYGHR